MFASYLRDRKQLVCIEGNYSSLRYIRCGVPQGSVLGPLLFLIYVNDMSSLKMKNHPNLFADDTAMFYFNSDVECNIRDAQCDLDVLSEYFRLNKLTLNVEKSKFMNIVPKNKVLPQHEPLKYKGICLGEVVEYKYLGMIWDKYLTWSNQIQKVRNVLACRVGIIRKLSHFLPRNVLLMLYFSLVHCHLEYLCLIWGSASACYLRPLQVLQNRSLRFIFRLSHQFPSVGLYELCNILPIKGLYCQQVCCFVKSVLCENEYHTLSFHGINHDHDTRHSSDLYYYVARNNFGRDKITTVGPRLYNCLPPELKDCNVNEFSAKIKEWLLLNAQLSKLTKFHVSC